MVRNAVAASASLGLCCSPPNAMMAACVSSPLRSAFFGACAPGAPGVSERLRARRGRDKRRECGMRISAMGLSGLDADLHDSMVQLQVGMLQRVSDLGFPLPSNVGGSGWWEIGVPAAIWYLVASPGGLSGLLDYAYAPLHALSNVSYNAEDVEVGRQIGQGSFGIVHEGYIGRSKSKESRKKQLHVILKKVRPRIQGAEQMRDVEVHMNRRVKRTAPNACADFLGTTEVSKSQTRGRLSEGLWLIWRFEGERTLDYYMKQKNFPENVAEVILGKKIAGSSKKEIESQRHEVIRKIASQILTCIRDLHKTGLVHRDVKPLNLILAEDSGTFKLVDLGAAVDLRSGFNYVPDETIIDPTYAAPEHHVMPISTPRLPPDPLCTLVSPLVWLLNTPDRFDLFSAGLIILQMAVKPLRQDIGLQSFNSEFKRAGYDLDAWRRKCRFSDEEFSLLDVNDSSGWELVRGMLQSRHDRSFVIWPSLGSSRPTADAALKHRFLTRTFITLPSSKAPEIPAVSSPLIKPNFPSIKLQSPLLKPVSPSINPVSPSIKPEFPSLEPRNLVPTFQALSTASTSALALATGWLVLNALKESTEKSYALGQWVMESTFSLASTGSVLLGCLLLIRSWPELENRMSRKGNRGAGLNLSDTSFVAADNTGSSIDQRDAEQDASISRHDEATIHIRGVDKATRPISGLDEATVFISRNDEAAVASYGLGEAIETNDQNLLATDLEALKNARVKELLAGGTQFRKVDTGVVDALKALELRLASLESSVLATREFGRYQQQQILKMEGLLNGKSQQPATSVQTTENSNELFHSTAAVQTTENSNELSHTTAVQTTEISNELFHGTAAIQTTEISNDLFHTTAAVQTTEIPGGPALLTPTAVQMPEILSDQEVQVGEVLSARPHYTGATVRTTEILNEQLFHTITEVRVAETLNEPLFHTTAAVQTAEVSNDQAMQVSNVL